MAAQLTDAAWLLPFFVLFVKGAADPACNLAYLADRKTVAVAWTETGGHNLPGRPGAFSRRKVRSWKNVVAAQIELV